MTDETASRSAIEPALDRDWWRAQGIDACMDRMVEITKRAESAERHAKALARIADEERAKYERLQQSAVGWQEQLAQRSSTRAPFIDPHEEYDGWGEAEQAKELLREIRQMTDNPGIQRKIADFLSASPSAIMERKG